MQKRLLVLALGITGLIQNAYAVNLIDAYHQSLSNDPTLRGAVATHLNTLEQVPQAQSYFFPTIQVTDTASKTMSSEAGQPGSVTANNANLRQNTYTVSLSQTLLNLNYLQTLSAAQATAKAADAQYFAAEQGLIQRVAQKYFAVLQAEDTLAFDQATKESYAADLAQTKQRYAVGLDKITSVYQAQAYYQNALATALSDQNVLANAQQQLATITGEYYPSIDKLKDNIPLKPPTPADVEYWVELAKTKNLQVVQDRFNAVANQYNVKAAQAGHMPNLALSSSYQGNSYDPANPVSHVDTSNIGVTLTIPIYQGGYVSSKARAAADTYQGSLATLETDYRAAMANTRNDYLTLLSTISQIQADKQAIISYRSALEGVRAGLEVGTNTWYDVLQAQQNLVQSQLGYTKDLYSYLNSIISLKYDVGQLTEEDLAQINSWLFTYNNSVTKTKTVKTVKKTKKRKVKKPT